MLTQEQKTKIAATISPLIQGYALESMEIRTGPDSDGDDAIFVDLWYALHPQEFDPDVLTTVRSAVRSMLVKDGELRFPYIRHHLKDGQKVRMVKFA